MNRPIKDFDEALEAHRLGEKVEYCHLDGYGREGKWYPVFHEIGIRVAGQKLMGLDEGALGACVKFRLKPGPRIHEILEELYDRTPKNEWRSVKAAKQALREALAKAKNDAYTGNLPSGCAAVDYFRELEREFCGEVA